MGSNHHDLAIAAAQCAIEAAGELMRFAREGDCIPDALPPTGPFDPLAEPVEKLLGAALTAIDIQQRGDLSGSEGQVYAAIRKYLEDVD